MRTAIAVAALAALLAGCQTRESANVYGKHEAGREQTVRFATVDAVRALSLGQPWQTDFWQAVLWTLGILLFFIPLSVYFYNKRKS